ncbi:MAG: hypothetical protein KAH30_02000 [Caldisericia bacterium]|nr:hypothetical protein [Caldisericia bacterium]
MKHFSSKRSSNQPSLPKTSSSHTSPHIETIPSLIPLEKVLIVEILEKPFVGVDEHTKRLGLHPKDMVKIQKSLSQMGIIKIETIERKKILSLTQEGTQLARSYNLKIPKHNSRGGLEHRYWVHQVFQHLKRNNFLPKTEYKDIDIAVPEHEIFIEIETGKSNIKSNIKKLNALPGKSKFMLATNKIALKTLENMNLSQSIKTITTHSFIKLTRNQILSED